MDPALLRRTAEIAADYLASLPERPVRADAALDELRSALRVALDDAPRPAREVIEELVAAAEPGLVSSQSPATSALSSAARSTLRSPPTG